MVWATTAMLIAGGSLFLGIVRLDAFTTMAGAVALVAASVLATAYERADARDRAVSSIEERFGVTVSDPRDAPGVFVVDDPSGPLTCTGTHDDHHLVCVDADGRVTTRTAAGD